MVVRNSIVRRLDARRSRRRQRIRPLHAAFLRMQSSGSRAEASAWRRFRDPSAFPLPRGASRRCAGSYLGRISSQVRALSISAPTWPERSLCGVARAKGRSTRLLARALRWPCPCAEGVAEQPRRYPGTARSGSQADHALCRGRTDAPCSVVVAVSVWEGVSRCERRVIRGWQCRLPWQAIERATAQQAAREHSPTNDGATDED